MAKLFANSGDPDQMPHSVASDLGLYCLPISLLGVARLQWVNSVTYWYKDLKELFYHQFMYLKFVRWIAKSVDPYQMLHSGASYLGHTLFAQVFLSHCLGEASEWPSGFR